MSSERRIQASRANGALSRGPVTSQGKLNSSRSSTRHGILAQTIVLDSESKTRFEELLASYITEFQPRTPAETNLVETMAIARWRHWRPWHIQRAGFDLEMARQETPEGSPPARAATVFRNLSDNSRSLDLLLRYETVFDRQFTRVLNALLKLQARPNRGDGATLPPEGVAATWDPESPTNEPHGHPPTASGETRSLRNEPSNPLKTNDPPPRETPSPCAAPITAPWRQMSNKPTQKQIENNLSPMHEPPSFMSEGQEFAKVEVDFKKTDPAADKENSNEEGS
jgi:hypothetical protein